MKIILFNLFVVVLLCLSELNCYALSVESHKAINVNIADTDKPLNGFSLGAYLKDNLSFVKGVKEEFNSKQVSEWISNGGVYEDLPQRKWYNPLTWIPYTRSMNHFHDPLKYLADAGYWPAESAILWSQEASGKQYRGLYSWHDARDYFYNALTMTDKATRDTNFAEMFRGVGQVMHLVSDMSVPEHSRNDGHVLEAYEEFVRDDKTGLLDAALKNPIYFNLAELAKESPFPEAGVPIARMFDSNFYYGQNPEITSIKVGNTATIGLSEYSNANFVSPDTIFKHYDYPKRNVSTEDSEDDYADPLNPGTFVKRKYFKKIAAGETNGGSGYKLAGMNYLEVTRFSTSDITVKEAQQFIPPMDADVFADYAKLLLPRAVGYSATMLNYFFRGSLTIDGTPEISFRTVKVTVANITPNEAAATGDVSLVIRYKALAETDLGNGKYLLSLPSDSYSYKVVTLTGIDMSKTQPLTFNFGNEPLPMNFSDMTMQLVYKGKLGNEDNSVAVSTPEPINGIYADFALSLPPSGVYAKTSDSSTSASFNELRVTALSNAPGGLTGGSIELALEYRTAIGDQFQSVLVETNPANAAGYIFRTPVKNGITTLPQGVPVELTFDLPQLPVQATDVEINIIYTNSGGTQAIGINDISEPTPVDVYNNTDYTCIENTWRHYDDPVAMAIIGSSNTYPQNLTDISFLAAPANTGTLDPVASNTLFNAGPLQYGHMQRLGYILTDYTNSYAFSATKEGNGYYPSLLSIPQTNAGLGFRNDGDTQNSMFMIRGTKMWGGNGIVFVNNEYPSGSNCTWADLNLLVGQ